MIPSVFELPPGFHDDPYASYAALRRDSPIARVEAPYHAYWVLSAALVREICARQDVFLKPGGDRALKHGPLVSTTSLPDGLFFMDPPRHKQVRALMDDVFGTAIQGAAERAALRARVLVDAAAASGQLDVVNGLAKPLAMQVFMEVMGIPQEPFPDDGRPGRGDDRLVDGLVGAALAARDPALPAMQRAAGAVATLALRTYLHARRAETALRQDSPGTILALMNPHVACPAADKLDADEAMNTAAHFALGGYLSTQFLIGSGVYNLLRTPGQWAELRQAPQLLPGAVNEMLRYDAPFQMAERWVETETQLGGARIPPQSLVVVVYGSANRDAGAYAAFADFGDPERFEIRRPADVPNFGFGDGIHRCIGEPLARAVTAAAVQALLERCPAARIAEVGHWSRDPFFRSLSRLLLFLR